MHRTTLKVYFLLGSLLLPPLCASGPAGALAAGPVNAGPGEVLTLPDGISVQGDAGSAITAFGGGQVSGSGTHAAGAGLSQPAVSASGAGSLVSLGGPGTVIDSSRVGVQMDSGGLVRLGDNSIININGVDTIGSAGIRIQNSTPEDAFGSGVTINIAQNAPRTASNGLAWIGVSVENGGSATFNNLTVQGSGANVGALANGVGSKLTLNGGNLAVNGDGSGSTNIWTVQGLIAGMNELGVYARSGAVINLNGTNLTHTVSGSVMGLYADSGGVINAENAGITMSGHGNQAATPGGSSAGVYVIGTSTANLKNSRVDILGNNFGGLRVGNGGVINGDGLVVTTSGTNDSALRYSGSSSAINLSGSTLTGLGPDNIGVIVNNTSGLHTLNMSGGSLDSTAQALYVNKGNALFNFSDGALVTGGNGILFGTTADNAQGMIAAKTGAVLNGDMQAAIMNSVSASLDSGAAWSGAARNIGPVAVAGGARWNITGNSDVQSLALDSGMLNFSPPAGSGYKTLTVRENYSGTDGTISLNTRLEGSDSPTDKLVVQGDTSGSSGLSIANAGGGGALTSGDGIRVVEVQGSSDGAFALRERVAAGLYEYTLHKGGNDGSWYLRSDLPAQPGTPDGIPDSPAQPGTPDGIPDSPARPGTPNIRPEAPLASALVPLAMEYGYSMLDTLHERVGESRETAGVPEAKDSVRRFGNAWGRALGSRLFHNADGGFMDEGASYDYSLGGVQAGMDVYSSTSASGPQNYAGLYLGYGHMDAGAREAQGGGSAGDIGMDAYSLGAYWTRYSSPERLGWYSDAVLQGTIYDGNAESSRKESFSGKGNGVLASWENGYAFDLGNNFTLEPQAQLAYQHVNFQNAKDSYGSFDFSDGSSLRGRAGVRLAKHINTGTAQEPRQASVWVRGNLWQEFLDGSTTTVSGRNGGNGVAIPARFDKTWGEAELGVSGQVSANLNLFATGGMVHSLDGNDRRGWEGRIGFRYEW